MKVTLVKDLSIHKEFLIAIITALNLHEMHHHFENVTNFYRDLNHFWY